MLLLRAVGCSSAPAASPTEMQLLSPASINGASPSIKPLNSADVSDCMALESKLRACAEKPRAITDVAVRTKEVGVGGNVKMGGSAIINTVVKITWAPIRSSLSHTPHHSPEAKRSILAESIPPFETKLALLLGNDVFDASSGTTPSHSEGLSEEGEASSVTLGIDLR